MASWRQSIRVSSIRDSLLPVSAIIFLLVSGGMAAGRGILSLDELNFDRVVNGEPGSHDLACHICADFEANGKCW